MGLGSSGFSMVYLLWRMIMPLFLDNTGLSCLKKGKDLDEQAFQGFLEKSRRDEVPGGGAYYTYLFDSGLELVFRVVENEGNREVMGMDTHMGGRCVWMGKPVVTVGQMECLGMQLLLSDPGESCAYTMGFVRPALLGKVDTQSHLETQVCAFPTGMDVYDDREAYEAMVGEENRLLDRQVLPYHYILAREEGISGKNKEYSQKHEMIDFLCGPVLSVEERENGFRGTSLRVATVATQMGHVDLVYGLGQGVRPLEKGCYLVASAYLSGDVISVHQQSIVP